MVSPVKQSQLYDHSNLVNIPPNIEINPFFKKIQEQKNAFISVEKNISKTVFDSPVDTDKYMWIMLLTTLGGIGASCYYCKKNWKVIKEKIKYIFK